MRCPSPSLLCLPSWFSLGHAAHTLLLANICLGLSPQRRTAARPDPAKPTLSTLPPSDVSGKHLPRRVCALRSLPQACCFCFSVIIFVHVCEAPRGPEKSSPGGASGAVVRVRRFGIGVHPENLF